jgi:hypothetical protein
MTRSEKLDQILYILLWIDKEELAGKKVNKKFTMPYINSCLNNDLEPWEMKSLQNELIEENFVISTDNDLRITERGKKFITRERGFKYLDRKSEQEQIIAEKTIEKFKYDKYSFWFSILAIVISIVSIFLK